MTVLLILLLVYLLVLVGVAAASLRPPRIPLFLSPGSLGAPQEDLLIESDGLELAAWWIEAPGDSVAVLAHGYIMNRSEMVPVAFRLWQEGVSCLLFDFRAHGTTKGGRSSFGLREANDVRAAVAVARARKPNAKIVLIGSSMGAAAAALALAEEPALADALVLDSGYSRLSSAVLGWWRFIGGKLLMVLLAPSGLLVGPFVGVNVLQVDVGRALEKVKGAPALLFHGDRDDLALPQEAERNRAALGDQAEIVWFAGAGHTEGRWTQPTRYMDALLAFLRRVGLLAE